MMRNKIVFTCALLFSMGVLGENDTRSNFNSIKVNERIILDGEKEDSIYEEDEDGEDDYSIDENDGEVSLIQEAIVPAQLPPEEEEEEGKKILPGKKDKNEITARPQVHIVAFRDITEVPADLFEEPKKKMPRHSLFLNEYATKKSPRMFGIGALDSRSNTDVFINNLSLQTPNSPLEGFFPGIVGKTMDKLGQQVDAIDSHNQVDLVKADMWVLPFLNVYVLAGHLKGNAAVTSRFTNWNSTENDVMGLKNIAAAQGANEVMPFNVDYSGNALGMGLTLAYGYGNWFTTLDYNYVQTNLDILKGHVKAQTISLIGGYNVTSKLDVYGGFSSTDIAQQVSGPIPDGMLPPKMDENMLGKGASFSLAARSKADWIPHVGTSYAFNDHFNANLTGNFDSEGRLTGQTFGLGYRF